MTGSRDWPDPNNTGSMRTPSPTPPPLLLLPCQVLSVVYAPGGTGTKCSAGTTSGWGVDTQSTSRHFPTTIGHTHERDGVNKSYGN